jgi:hypothetical protein
MSSRRILGMLAATLAALLVCAVGDRAQAAIRPGNRVRTSVGKSIRRARTLVNADWGAMVVSDRIDDGPGYYVVDKAGDVKPYLSSLREVLVPLMRRYPIAAFRPAESPTGEIAENAIAFGDASGNGLATVTDSGKGLRFHVLGADGTMRNFVLHLPAPFSRKHARVARDGAVATRAGGASKEILVNDPMDRALLRMAPGAKFGDTVMPSGMRVPTPPPGKAYVPQIRGERISFVLTPER